jgi:DnaJ-domain-containing protein 1
LFEQIELREQISEAQQAADFEQLEQIEKNLQLSSSELEQELSESLSNPATYAAAIEQIKHLAFYQKLEHLVSEILNNL